MDSLPSRISESATACDYAVETVIGFLDALNDAMTLARPGTDASRFASDLRRLGDGAGFVAREIEAIMHGAAQAASIKEASPEPLRKRAFPS
ncbi:hypothetical protein ACSMXM_04330 [Pacificimonas sp. ICDLI1SI03]